MSKSASEQSGRPLIFLAVKWYAYVFAGMYVLYGGVKIALSMLDRNYTDMVTPIFFGAMGIAQYLFAFAFRDQRKFGWYGLVIINALVIVLSIFTLKERFSTIAPLCSALALAALFAPPVKERFSRSR
ncbi:MAG: hypothetical protein HY851_01380 [candidate division Zixibacteria bacterium]|nr:hypothetical protein [candidate division Zixibacteria bacterium]